VEVSPDDIEVSGDLDRLLLQQAWGAGERKYRQMLEVRRQSLATLGQTVGSGTAEPESDGPEADQVLCGLCGQYSPTFSSHRMLMAHYRAEHRQR
jgi:hypothetical protein